MDYTCAAREEAADRAADRLAAFSAPSPARTNLTAVQEAADRAAAFAVHFTPPAQSMIARARFPADTGERAYTHFPDLLGVN